jgi:hypothetical protein
VLAVVAWSRRLFVPALLVAALTLPALAPDPSAGAEPIGRGDSSPLAAFQALGPAAPERGPGRHDEGRRLDAIHAPARLTAGSAMPRFAPPRPVARDRFLGCPTPIARWCLAHSTTTASP